MRNIGKAIVNAVAVFAFFCIMCFKRYKGNCLVRHTCERIYDVIYLWIKGIGRLKI